MPTPGTSSSSSTQSDAVDWVAYPELPDHPDHELAKRLLPRGSGAIFSFGIKGGRDAGRRFIERLTVFSHLANVGDAKSLVIHPASTTHATMSPDELRAAGVGEELVRLSIGLEDADDLIADLERAPCGRRSGAERCCSTSRDARCGLQPAVATSTLDRPLLVLLHGAGMDHTVWSLVMRALAHRGYSVLAPDLPGHGKSDGPAPSSVEDYAEWTVALIEATGFASTHLAGHSLGSAIALQTAANRPELVDSLILLGTAATMPVHPDLQAAADAGDHKAIELMMSWALAPSAHLGRHPAPGMAMRSAGMRLMESVDAAVLASDLRASADYARAVEAATAVTVPELADSRRARSDDATAQCCATRHGTRQRAHRHAPRRRSLDDARGPGCRHRQGRIVSGLGHTERVMPPSMRMF